MKMIILSTSDGWEGLYINDTLVDEGSPLGEGNSAMYIREKAKLYECSGSDVILFEINSVDDDYLIKYGNFPKQLTELNGNYK